MVKLEIPEVTAMRPVPQKEHEWLQRLVGEWTYEGEMTIGPDKPPTKFTGTEQVRSLNGIWFIAESEGLLPDGSTATMITTLGYDPLKQRYVGSWIGSMMTYLWHYEGALNETRKVLILESVGPNIYAPGTMAKFEDSIEFINNDHRTMASRMYSDEGILYDIMKTNYLRKK